MATIEIVLPGDIYAAVLRFMALPEDEQDKILKIMEGELVESLSGSTKEKS